MNKYLLAALWLATLPSQTLLFFTSVMCLRTAKNSGALENMNLSIRWTAYSILAVGLVLDVLLNWIWLTIVFQEFPQETLSTNRVKRLKNTGSGWRQVKAAWFCKQYLTPFDPTHCNP